MMNTAKTEKTAPEVLVEPAREIRIVSEVDVAVVGGGTAGVMAAVGASREGAKVCVIERFGDVGGMLSAGLMGHFANRFRDPTGHDCIDSMPRQLLKNIVASGGTPYVDFEEALADGQMIFYRHEHAGRECLRLLEEANVELWLQARFCRVLPAPERGYDILIECKEGRRAVRARQVVDCTGEADVARSMDAPMQAEKTLNYSWGLLFEMGLVDLPRYEGFLEECSSSCPEWTTWLASYLGISVEELKEDKYWGDWLDGKKRAWPFRLQIMKAVDAGDFDLIRNLPEGGMVRYGWDGFWPEPWHGADTVHANVCMVTGLDPGNGRHVSVAEAGARAYAFDFLSFLRKYIPGFEKAVIRTMSMQTVPRGGVEIVGETRLETKDFEARTIREDTICLAGAIGLPLGMFVPRGVDNLLVAGRCADRGYSVRASVSCLAMGYSCGIIAALAAKREVTPMRLDNAECCATLKKHDVLLAPGERVPGDFPLRWPELPGVPSQDADDGLKRAEKLS